jgi:hypothetical protein
LAERRAEGLEHLLRGIERNAADEMKLTGHGMSFAYAHIPAKWRPVRR